MLDSGPKFVLVLYNYYYGGKSNIGNTSRSTSLKSELLHMLFSASHGSTI